MAKKQPRSNRWDLAHLAEPVGWGAVMGAVMSGHVPPIATSIAVVLAALALFAQTVGIVRRRR